MFTQAVDQTRDLFLELYSNIITQSPLPLWNPVLPHLYYSCYFFRSFGPPYFLAALLTLLLSILQFASPQIVNLLINFVQVS